MGNDSSKPKDQQNAQPAAQPSKPAPGRILKDTKKVLLLHKSTKKQEFVVRNFRDVLTDNANGSIKVVKMVNIADANHGSDLKDSSWLDEIDNVVLLCLTSESISLLEQIMRDKGYVQDGRLHGKVFWVSFGASLSSQWPPGGIQKGSEHVRDFAFNFENVDDLKPKDFERSDRMTAIIAAMKGTN